MGVIHGLPSDVEETLIDIAEREGRSDYVEVLQRAVAQLRKRLFDPAKPVTIAIELGEELEALAWPGSWDPPRMWIADRRVHIEFVCAGDTPTAAEVAAIERLAEAAAEALALFRKAHRTGGGRLSTMTGMDDGPSGPGLPVPNEPEPATPDRHWTPGADLPEPERPAFPDPPYGRTAGRSPDHPLRFRSCLVKLIFIRKTVASGDTNCPALYRTDRDSYIVQGRLVRDLDAMGYVRNLAADEVLVEVPADVIDGPAA